MRLLFNGLPLSGAKTGIGHYSAELIRCLAAQAQEVVPFHPTWAWQQLRALAQRTTARAAASATPAHPAVNGTAKERLSWRQRLRGHVRDVSHSWFSARFRGFARRGGFDLYHETNFIPITCDLPTVTTIHDLSVQLHPEWHPADRVAWYERNFLPSLSRSTHFLAISESARREIIATLGIAPEKISRTYMGVRPGLGPLPERQVRDVLRRLGLPPRYLLHVGTLEPRKNLLMLLRAYCDLPASLRESYPLVLVGGWGWNSAELAAYLRDTARHKGVIQLGYLPNADVPAVYNGARALLFPTFYEGFGMPPIEMMACGGAVLASTADAVAETTAGKAHLIDPHDVAAWRDAMRCAIEDESWWASLRRGTTEVAARYTWEQCALDTLSAYRQALGGSPRKRTAA